MHHSDSESVCIVGVLYANLNTVFFDNAFFRLIQSKQYAHQRRFAGTVFTEKCMYLAFFYPKGNVIVGNDTRELFGYAKHLYCVLIFQPYRLPFCNI